LHKADLRYEGSTKLLIIFAKQNFYEKYYSNWHLIHIFVHLHSIAVFTARIPKKPSLMANDINKKISVEVEITKDGQEQIDQYKTAFDGLRVTIANLGKPLANLSKNINSLNRDLSQLASATEKNAAKLVAATKKASDWQAKINADSNRKLKTSLSEADKLKEQSFIKELQTRNKYYGELATTETDQYDQQKAKLDRLFKAKGVRQDAYNQEAEQLLKQHIERIRQIMDQYIKDNPELTATGIKQIDAHTLNQVDVKSISLLKSPKINDSFFSKFINGFKRAFGTISGYYKKSQNAQSKVAADTAKQTADKVTATEKAAQDKKLALAIDNAKKLEDTISGIVTKGIDDRAKKQVAALEAKKASELANTSLTAAQQQAIKASYQKKEDDINKKAFKEKQKISIGQAIINGAISITKSEADLGPIAGTIAIAAIVANTAAQIATISAQKPPALARGGYFKSDGKGAVLPGYSRTDNTNAFLRSGEAVVVSEAMRDPWARNLVSAINVAYGGRDFSVPNITRGYSVGGIFTDGGNANRYYNQPVNDQKNLANTVAYQMVNNFPPVYVDVKDINNQQNILVQTINRVNL
jgi:hypothetical protein